VTLRARVDRLTTRNGAHTEVWFCDLGSDGDGLCRPAGRDAPALTPAQLAALPTDRRRTIVEFVDALEAPR
jgi:hypothetical protein